MESLKDIPEEKRNEYLDNTLAAANAMDGLTEEELDSEKEAWLMAIGEASGLRREDYQSNIHFAAAIAYRLIEGMEMELAQGIALRDEVANNPHLEESPEAQRILASANQFIEGEMTPIINDLKERYGPYFKDL